MTSAPPPPGDDPAGRREEFLVWPDGTGVGLHVPDDISELDGDVALWRHEQIVAHRAARRAAWSRWIPRTWRRYGATAPLLIVSMLLIGTFGAMLVLFGPRAGIGQATGKSPLATPTVSPGRIGGLLPNVTLETLNNSAVGTRQLRRPALLVLAPGGCTDCAAVVRHVLAASEPYPTMARYVVATSPADAEKLAVTTGRPVIGLVDRDAKLFGQLAAGTAGAAGPTLTVIGADGTIRAKINGVSPDTALTGTLDKVTSPSFSAGATG